MKYLDPILLPLARLAIRKSWLFPAVEQQLRRAYIKAAETTTNDRITDSKISVMTGLQRRDITRLRKDSAPLPDQRQPLAEIIALWWSDPAYDPSGIPVLGDGTSFTSLARRVRQDVHPRTFLDILIENGAVRENDACVVLDTRSYKPLAGSDDQLAYLSANIGDHLDVAVSNVVDATDNYDMAVHYTGLSKEAVHRLDAHFRQGMTQILEELDTIARALPPDENGPFRFRAGGYFFDDILDEDEIRDP